jgi:hypothetical protein
VVNGVRAAIVRATTAVRAVATDARAERAALFASGLDAKRIDLFGAEAELRLFEKKAGTGDEPLLTVTAGWHAEPSAARGTSRLCS